MATVVGENKNFFDPAAGGSARRIRRLVLLMRAKVARLGTSKHQAAIGTAKGVSALLDGLEFRATAKEPAKEPVEEPVRHLVMQKLDRPDMGRAVAMRAPGAAVEQRGGGSFGGGHDCGNLTDCRAPDY